MVHKTGSSSIQERIIDLKILDGHNIPSPLYASLVIYSGMELLGSNGWLEEVLYFSGYSKSFNYHRELKNSL